MSLQPRCIAVCIWPLQMCPLWPFAFRFHASFPLEEGCRLHSPCQLSAVYFQAEMPNKSYFMSMPRLFQKLYSLGLQIKLERRKEGMKSSCFHFWCFIVRRSCKMIRLHIRSVVQNYYQWTAESCYQVSVSFTTITSFLARANDAVDWAVLHSCPEHIEMYSCSHYKCDVVVRIPDLRM